MLVWGVEKEDDKGEKKKKVKIPAMFYYPMWS